MIQGVDTFAKEFLQASKNKPVRIIANNDAAGIAAAAILIKTLTRLDKKFSIQVTNNLSEEFIESRLANQQKEILLFCDIGIQGLGKLKKTSQRLFIIDAHSGGNEKPIKNISVLSNTVQESNTEDTYTSAALAYFFAKTIDPKNTDLSNLAMIGILQDNNIVKQSQITKEIIKDTKDLDIRKGLILYPATRPLKKALEYSVAPYIQGVTGSADGVSKLLKETNIPETKSLIELDEQEMSRLTTAILLRQSKKSSQENIIRDVYTLKLFGKKEDLREIVVILNACIHLGHSDTALAYCLGNEKAKTRILDIYTKYKQEIVTGIKTAEKIDSIQGRGFVILNAGNKIKDAIVGTVCSMLSSSPTYEEGTILIGMAYNKDKIKVSARIAGKGKRNVKEVLEKTITMFRHEHPETKIEFGGDTTKAGCLLEKENEKQFIETLKKNLEVEIIRV